MLNKLSELVLKSSLNPDRKQEKTLKFSPTPNQIKLLIEGLAAFENLNAIKQIIESPVWSSSYPEHKQNSPLSTPSQDVISYNNIHSNALSLAARFSNSADTFKYLWLYQQNKKALDQYETYFLIFNINNFAGKHWIETNQILNFIVEHPLSDSSYTLYLGWLSHLDTELLLDAKIYNDQTKKRVNKVSSISASLVSKILPQMKKTDINTKILAYVKKWNNNYLNAIEMMVLKSNFTIEELNNYEKDDRAIYHEYYKYGNICDLTDNIKTTALFDGYKTLRNNIEAANQQVTVNLLKADQLIIFIQTLVSHIYKFTVFRGSPDENTYDSNISREYKYPTQLPFSWIKKELARLFIVHELPDNFLNNINNFYNVTQLQYLQLLRAFFVNDNSSYVKLADIDKKFNETKIFNEFMRLGSSRYEYNINGLKKFFKRFIKINLNKAEKAAKNGDQTAHFILFLHYSEQHKESEAHIHSKSAPLFYSFQYTDEQIKELITNQRNALEFKRNREKTLQEDKNNAAMAKRKAIESVNVNTTSAPPAAGPSAPPRQTPEEEAKAAEESAFREAKNSSQKMAPLAASLSANLPPPEVPAPAKAPYQIHADAKTSATD